MAGRTSKLPSSLPGWGRLGGAKTPADKQKKKKNVVIAARQGKSTKPISDVGHADLDIVE
jgi:hypothetical protein